MHCLIIQILLVKRQLSNIDSSMIGFEVNHNLYVVCLYGKSRFLHTKVNKGLTK